jgi:CRISPR/Cas system-associated exonuclease Cas4 (RecB family)
MTQEREHHPFGFSRLDKLSHCLHFEGKPAGKPAARGTDIHTDIEAVVKGEKSPSSVSIELSAARVKTWLPTILSIEDKFSLLGRNFEELTFGYPDYIGEDEEGNLVVLDIKSGSQPPESYRLQLTAIALAAMDEYEQESCKCVLVYTDSGEDYAFDVTYAEAQEAIYPLFERIANHHNEPPQENDFCNWCAKKSTCPVWVTPAQSVAVMEESSLDLPTFSKEWILASPENAAKFWTAYKKFTGLVESWEVDDKIKAWLGEGKAVPGWKTQTRKGRQSVDTDKVLSLVVPEIGLAHSSKFLTVKPKELQETWAKFTSNPLPVEITEGESTVSLVAAKGGK